MQKVQDNLEAVNDNLIELQNLIKKGEEVPADQKERLILLALAAIVQAEFTQIEYLNSISKRLPD